MVIVERMATAEIIADTVATMNLIAIVDVGSVLSIVGDRSLVIFSLICPPATSLVLCLRGMHFGTDGGTMLMRGIGAVALSVSLSSGALAERQQGVMHRISCTMVRIYVARYSASTAEIWARSHGATEAQIEAARECLKGTADQTAQDTRWFAR